MSNPFERPAKAEKIKNFDELSDKEQAERFRNLKVLFVDEEKRYELKNQNDKDRSNYIDFIENIYKYPEKFDIGSKDGAEKSKIFDQAVSGNKIIKKALDFFLAVKKNSAANNTQDEKLMMIASQKIGSEMAALERLIDDCGHEFADQKTHQLYIDKLVNLFKWSLNSFITGGEKISRTPVIEKEEVDVLCNDLESILKYVNAGR